ncbi:MAG: hypothetical protein FWC41_00285 [Firmicutes bacterium]|nr:hypothetical protein [Bacillota bacterium]
MSTNSQQLAILESYEKEKLYRVFRRYDALYNLLETLDNSKIIFEDKDQLVKKINEDISECKEKKKGLWSIIQKKYALPSDLRTIKLSILTGEIVKATPNSSKEV